MSLSIIFILRQNFVNTFFKVAILGKLYQYRNCYTKLEQHWIECICVHSSPITHLFDRKKVRTLHLSAFSQKFPNCDLLHFRQIRNPNFNTLWSLFWINIINISVSSTLSCVHCSFNIRLFAVVFHEGNYLIDASYNLRNLEITTSALNRFF